MTFSTKIAVKEMYRLYCELKEHMKKLEKTDENDKLKLAEKKTLQRQLFDFQKDFESINHRPVQTLEDWRPVISEYRRYKSLKKSLGMI